MTDFGEQYDRVVYAVGRRAAERLLAVWDEAEWLDEAAPLMAAILAGANVEASAAALLALYGSLADATGQLVPPAAVPPRSSWTDTGRLQAAVELIHAEADVADPRMRLERLAHGETSSTAAEAYGDALQADERVSGWVRRVNAGGCQLCSWWARNGRVWPAELTMPRHTGCRCTQTPVVVDQITDVDSRTWARSDRDKAREAAAL